MSPRNASMKNWAKSAGASPASAARRMITSSMSVKFCTKTTRFPRNSRYRRATSNAMYERAWPRWLKSYVVGPQTYILTTPGVRGTNASFFLVRVLYNRTPIVAAASHVLGVLKGLARLAKGQSSFPSFVRGSLALLACTTKPICRPPMCGSPTGPIDQRKIAAFARRKPWVQIPLGPLFDCRRSETHSTLGDSCAALRAENVLRLHRGPASRARVLEPLTALPAETISRSQRLTAGRAGGFAVRSRFRFRGAVFTEDDRRASPSAGLPAGGLLPAFRAGSVSRLARLDHEEIGPC